MTDESYDREYFEPEDMLRINRQIAELLGWRVERNYDTPKPGWQKGFWYMVSPDGDPARGTIFSGDLGVHQLWNEAIIRGGYLDFCRNSDISFHVMRDMGVRVMMYWSPNLFTVAVIRAHGGVQRTSSISMSHALAKALLDHLKIAEQRAHEER